MSDTVDKSRPTIFKHSKFKPWVNLTFAGVVFTISALYIRNLMPYLDLATLQLQTQSESKRHQAVVDELSSRVQVLRRQLRKLDFEGSKNLDRYSTARHVWLVDPSNGTVLVSRAARGFELNSESKDSALKKAALWGKQSSLENPIEIDKADAWVGWKTTRATGETRLWIGLFETKELTKNISAEEMHGLAVLTGSRLSTKTNTPSEQELGSLYSSKSEALALWKDHRPTVDRKKWIHIVWITVEYFVSLLFLAAFATALARKKKAHLKIIQVG